MGLIEFRQVTKEYGPVKALDNASLVLEPLKIYGLLGRNGAGKTTMLNILTNKIFPTSGEILFNNESVIENDRVQSQMFYMTEMKLYPSGMRISQVFRWTREFYPQFDMEYAQVLAHKFALNLRKQVKTLSTGYSSIMKLILAMASNAPVIIFDEPVLGLDANHRDLFYHELMARYNEHPQTIIISTHLIDEIADVLEEAIIIKDGRLVLHQPVEQLLQSAYTVSGADAKVDQFIKNRKVIHQETLGRLKSAAVYEQLNSQIRRDAEALGLDISGAPLQKLFIYLTN
jgi:ABC-2 type transport system ATP-binding protein